MRSAAYTQVKYVYALALVQSKYCLCRFCGKMSTRQYFKPRDGLPDPKGPLSRAMDSRAIAQANKEVEKVLSSGSATNPNGKRRGPYTR